MPSFQIVLCLPRAPWPFSWGPFKCRRTLRFHTDRAEALIYQKGDKGDPITLECFTSTEACTTTVDFRGGSRLKRRTSFVVVME